MTEMSRTQNHIQTVLDFLLAAVFIAMGGSMYQYIEPTKGFLGKACIALTAICVILSFFIRKAYKDRKTFLRGIVITAIIVLYLVIFVLIKPVNVKSYIMMLLQVFALSVYVFICCGNDRIPGALIRYSQLVTVIAAASIVCWLLFSVLRAVPNSGEVQSYWVSDYEPVSIWTFYNIYFEPQWVTFFGKYIVRNCAIFTEAPIFTWHLVIAFFVELFIQKKVSFVRTIIIGLALITTVSTTGYIAGVLAVIVRIVVACLKSERYRSLSKGAKAAIWIIAAAVVIAVAAGSIFLLKEKFASYSGSTRIEDFRVGFLGWMDNFWTGAGFGNRERIYIHREIYSDYGFSNGIMEVAAEGGVYLLICFVGPFIYGFIDAVRRKDAELAIFAVFVFVMASITSSQYTYLMYFLQLFMLSGIKIIGEKEKLTE